MSARTHSPQLSQSDGGFAMYSDAHYPEQSPRAPRSGPRVLDRRPSPATVRHLPQGDPGRLAPVADLLHALPARGPSGPDGTTEMSHLRFRCVRRNDNPQLFRSWRRGPTLWCERLGPNMALLVDHGDEHCEFRYLDSADTFAEQEPITVVGARRTWAVVSMANDWATVFGGDARDWNKSRSEG